jgi:hypothetical protein
VPFDYKKKESTKHNIKSKKEGKDCKKRTHCENKTKKNIINNMTNRGCRARSSKP